MFARRRIAGWLAVVAAAACLTPLPAPGRRASSRHRRRSPGHGGRRHLLLRRGGRGRPALARFTQDPAPRFLDGDLYIFVLSEEGVSLAHGAMTTLVGSDLSDLRDVDGKALMREMLTAATADGAWVDYKWMNPVTGAIEPKSSWVRRHDDRIFGVGVYRP